jgi:hypothetical protein
MARPFSPRCPAPPRAADVGSSCDAATKGAIGAGRYKEASMGELAAQEMLVKNWAQYVRAQKTLRVGTTAQGGSIYAELISCLDSVRDAHAIKKADPFFDVPDQEPKRAPSDKTMRSRCKQ